MTRQEIINHYKVDDQGIILSPGKFENEPVYVPYFWDAYLNGFADDDDGKVLTFIVNQDDRKEFPELTGIEKVRLASTDDGFVGEV